MKYTVHVIFNDSSIMKFECEHYDIDEDTNLLTLSNPDFSERRYIQLSSLKMFSIVK